MKKIPKPTDLEYAVYYEPFLQKLSADINIFKQLKDNATTIKSLLASLTEQQLTTTYAPGKWTIKDILQHLIDFERVLIYRAMCFARNDKRPIPFFDENEYVKQANATHQSIKKILKDYKAVRQATLAFFDNQTAATLKRSGIASNYTMSVRACAWIICGHEMHHITVIKERYLQL
ncbi:MAG: DinB family protein [Ferruginibacter sp.]|nr:DinB family protein [Ferruginibacter sp.]